MGSTTRSTWADWFNRQLKTFFMEGMTEAIGGDNLIYTQLANIETLENPKDQLATFTGGQFYSRHGEFEPAKTYEPGDGWRISITPYIYKNAFIVNKYVRRFDDKGFIATHTRLLGAYGLQSLDSIFVNMLNVAFDVTFPIYDGQPLCSLNHPLKNSAGVVANRPAVGGGFNQTTYKDAINYFMDIPNDDGLPFQMSPVFWVGHPDKLIDAEITLGTIYDPTVPNSGTPSVVAVSPFRPRIIVTSKLIDSRNWFLLAKKGPVEGSGHGLSLWFTPGGMPTTKAYQKEDPDYTKFIGEFQVAAVVTKWRGVWGNPGF